MLGGNFVTLQLHLLFGTAVYCKHGNVFSCGDLLLQNTLMNPEFVCMKSATQ